VPNLSITIRNFCIAVHRTAGRTFICAAMASAACRALSVAIMVTPVVLMAAATPYAAKHFPFNSSMDFQH
jgi:hypothetical protein